VKDRQAQLHRTLQALAPLHCIVVDDASDDPAATARVARDHGAVLVRLATNVGPAAARNVGLSRVSTPYVAFVDSDIDVRAVDLLRLTRHFADPAVVLVAPRVEGQVQSSAPRWFEKYDALRSSLSLGTTAAHVRPGSTVGWLPSACLVGRTSSLAGGFDAGLRVGEDVDLVWRLVAGGTSVRYDPTVEARHDVRATVRSWLGRKFAYGTSGGVLAARHGKAVAPAVLSPVYAAAGAALLLRRRWSLPVAAFAVLHGTRQVRGSLPETNGQTLLAGRIASRGLGSAVRQESGLLLRHWWPATALLALRSQTVRRGLGTALAIDCLLAVSEQRRRGRAVPLGTLLLGRRLDDLAYGAGLWWGAWEVRSPGGLLPRRPGGRSGVTGLPTA
jgi:mycofactocin system glycosyltransferase